MTFLETKPQVVDVHRDAPGESCAGPRGKRGWVGHGQEAPEV